MKLKPFHPSMVMIGVLLMKMKKSIALRLVTVWINQNGPFVYRQNLGESILYLWVEKIREVLVEKAQSSDPEPDIKKITEEVDEDDGSDFLLDYQPTQENQMLNCMTSESQEEYTVKISRRSYRIVKMMERQLQILNVHNVLVVVSRWYGGILLGPDRFKHINNCARNVLVEYDYVPSTTDLDSHHAQQHCRNSACAFCMPLYIPYALTGTWHLGRSLCKLWLVMDYLVCTASVFNIVLISYDRFLSVTKAVSYRAQQGIMSSSAIKMVAIWVLAFLLYCPAILSVHYVIAQKTDLSWTAAMHNSTAEIPHVAARCNETWPTQPPSSEFSLGVLVLLAFLMVLLCLVTILGNMLVILAFMMDRNLRHRSNYFFLNLAVSDFAVGVCHPYELDGVFVVAFTVSGSHAPNSCKVLIPLALQTIGISNKAYRIIRLSYRAQQGITSNPAIKMVAIWVLAFLLYCPAILFWEHVAGHSVVAVDQCYAEFLNNWYFLLCASTLEFFVPLLLVTYFNVHIFHNIQRRQRRGSVQDCEPPRSSSLSWRFCGLLRPGAASSSSEAEDSVSSSMRPKKESLGTDCSSPSRDNSVTPENDF
ncbi:Histamine H3 receptor [Lonchura striata]|uniref:Histamine H3 receptor n=1 Tax=Lonchura striata TaxID=40157 RepID=A0A218V258_9PASE|nr:Histamine H3 receptor [Lonchura striata domestica]